MVSNAININSLIMKKIYNIFFFLFLFLSFEASAQKVIFFKEKNIALDSITSFSSLDFTTQPYVPYNPQTDTSNSLTVVAEKAIINEIGYWKNMSDHGHLHEGNSMFGVKIGVQNGGVPSTTPALSKTLKYPTTLYIYIDFIQDEKIIFRGVSAFDSMKSNLSNEEKVHSLVRAIFEKFKGK